jgi:hypothetical protein
VRKTKKNEIDAFVKELSRCTDSRKACNNRVVELKKKNTILSKNKVFSIAVNALKCGFRSKSVMNTAPVPIPMGN